MCLSIISQLALLFINDKTQAWTIYKIIHNKGYNSLVHVLYILPIFHFSSTRVLWYSSVPQLQKPLAGCTPTHVYRYCYQSDSFSSDRFKLDFCLSRIYGRSGLHWLNFISLFKISLKNRINILKMFCFFVISSLEKKHCCERGCW